MERVGHIVIIKSKICCFLSLFDSFSSGLVAMVSLPGFIIVISELE